jgi:MOSC domain-containing protein YiiM
MNFLGKVHSIGIATVESGAIKALDEVTAIPGKGLVGDRYAAKFEADPSEYGPQKEITLIELEAIEALNREKEIIIQPLNARRNVVTQGVPLNHLVGHEFQVGKVKLKGIKLCNPCAHLESLTERGVLAGLIHRGGLRAQIINEGIIRVGDVVEPTE